MKGKYTAMQVSKFIINYAYNRDNPINNLKLQNYLYLLWIEYYRKNKEYLFSDTFEAWQFGPVISNIYYEFCAYGGIPIMREYKIDIDNHDQDIIVKTIDNYIEYSPYELVNITRREGMPWYKVFNHGLGSKEEIPFKLIIDAYAK